MSSILERFFGEGGEPPASVLLHLAGLVRLGGHTEAADRLASVAAEVESLPRRQQEAHIRRWSETVVTEFESSLEPVVQALGLVDFPAAVAAAQGSLPPDLARLAAWEPRLVPLVQRLTAVVPISDLDDLDLALADRALVDGAGLDQEAADALARGVDRLATESPAMPLGRAWSRVEHACDWIARHAPDADVHPAGGLARFEPAVRQLEVLVVAPGAGNLAATLAQSAGVAADSARRHRAFVLEVDHDPVLVRVAEPAQAGVERLRHTGSRRYVRTLLAEAAARGLRWTREGLVGPDGRFVDGRDEQQVCAALGVSWLPPELRHDTARPDTRPPEGLIARADIRGDLHVHTLWSDGRDSVADVAYAARALGYEYVAITDHSPSAAASRVLTLDRLAGQRAEIDRVRASISGIRVVHGIEVDILPDGRLDFPDEVLAGFDLVLASLHDPAGQPPRRLLERYQRAMAHPLVTILTHPANRTPGRDNGYELDWDVLFATAAATGTVLEIDGGPAHLDLDGALAARALQRGVLLAVDSDCHHAGRLERQMQFAVGTARRGGVTRDRVLNTRPWAEIEALVAAKRSRGDRGDA